MRYGELEKIIDNNLEEIISLLAKNKNITIKGIKKYNK